MSNSDLVQLLTEAASSGSKHLAGRIEHLEQVQESVRDMLITEDLLLRDPSDEIASPDIRVIGVDGANIVDSRIFGDICGVTAVGHGGGEPLQDAWAGMVPRASSNAVVLAGIRAAMEVRLAAHIDEPFVFLDGSMTAFLFSFLQAAEAAEELPDDKNDLRDAFYRTSEGFLTSFFEIALSNRHFAFPKYTTQFQSLFNEMAARAGFNGQLETRSLLSAAMRAGEFTTGAPVLEEKQGFLFDKIRAFSEKHELPDLASRVDEVLGSLYALYFKPWRWSDAIRVDLPRPVYLDAEKRRELLAVVRRETRAPAIKEPLCLHLADREAKDVSYLPELFTRMAMQHIGRSEHKLLVFTGYRTD